MPTEREIKDKYKLLHDTLSDSYYAGTSGLTKERFDQQHGQIWANMEAEIKTASDYTEPIPPRDFEAEIDELKADIKLIKDKLEK